MKRCNGCLVEKPFDQFGRRPSRPCNLQPRCRTCQSLSRKIARQADELSPAKSRRSWLRRYNVSEAWFEAQALCGCTICGTKRPGGRGRFKIDHDHRCCPGPGSCGHCVRGVLCNKCNIGLGLFQDDVELLKRAAEYLMGES